MTEKYRKFQKTVKTLKNVKNEIKVNISSQPTWLKLILSIIKPSSPFPIKEEETLIDIGFKSVVRIFEHKAQTDLFSVTNKHLFVDLYILTQDFIFPPKNDPKNVKNDRKNFDNKNNQVIEKIDRKNSSQKSENSTQNLDKNEKTAEKSLEPAEMFLKTAFCALAPLFPANFGQKAPFLLEKPPDREKLTSAAEIVALVQFAACEALTETRRKNSEAGSEWPAAAVCVFLAQSVAMMRRMQLRRGEWATRELAVLLKIAALGVWDEALNGVFEVAEFPKTGFFWDIELLLTYLHHFKAFLTIFPPFNAIFCVWIIFKNFV